MAESITEINPCDDCVRVGRCGNWDEEGLVAAAAYLTSSAADIARDEETTVDQTLAAEFLWGNYDKSRDQQTDCKGCDRDVR